MDHSKAYKQRKVPLSRSHNMQVVLRCRPLSEDENRAKTPVAISCNEHRREVSVIQNLAHKQIDKTFVFDRVFGPGSQQKDLFEEAIAPRVNEALEGYNCTVVALGQTGTGKTYTMEGERRMEKNGGFHKDAGVIPRAVQQIFYILEAQNAEYNMKVTFLELYNGEITDLLVPKEASKSLDDKSRRPITLMEDGKGTVSHTAETLRNKQSNRSHSIFSITIRVKECIPEGFKLIKCGKLNLVDLAERAFELRSELENAATELFRNIASEADVIINNLQDNLNNQEEKIAEFAQQQHEAQTRTLQTTQSISRIMLSFFKSLSINFSRLTLLMEEAQTINIQELRALEKKLEECVADEERHTLDKVAEILRSSNARKRMQVQTAVEALRGNAAGRTSQLHQEMSNIQDSTTSVHEEWTSYIQKMGTQYIDTTVLRSGKGGLEGLKLCMEKAQLAAEQWKNAEESSFSLQRRYVDSVDSIVNRDEVEGNQLIRARVSSAALSTMEELDDANNSFLLSIEDLLKLDLDASKKINYLIAPCRAKTREMETTHSHKTLEIIQNAERCLIHKYKVDQPSHWAQQNQPFDLPSASSIEDLKTHGFEELLKSYQGTRVTKINGDVNRSSGFSGAAQSLHHKFSLSTIN
ncbi:Kinesin-like protein [Actinidia chinensis var. chinensis]|uniref:Kinesin-like protein n=1 Tax=Actinidia chinensis var. chinensis TaxID=1590841 RepID=A0A2R6PWS4_ACTCC|nr:Kinesin-like protein [Actinidia chinensis var. chinensis]